MVQIVTLALAVLAIIWHQQRTTEKLRDDFNRAHKELRDEFNGAHKELRDEFNGAHKVLRDEFGGLGRDVAENGKKLARIEGFLGIGIPPEAAERAAGSAALPAEGQ